MKLSNENILIQLRLHYLRSEDKSEHIDTRWSDIILWEEIQRIKGKNYVYHINLTIVVAFWKFIHFQISCSSFWWLQKYDRRTDASKLRNIDSIYNLLLSTVVSDDKLDNKQLDGYIQIFIFAGYIAFFTQIHVAVRKSKLHT